ncbi:contractile injection system tape measure protein [Flavobacterium adhaerens]|uniref:contractile injection system tape measure protein n=1 Tax=Flavobacterium adhaerens TaxID=3149043 RepID=UPI0032B50E0C
MKKNNHLIEKVFLEINTDSIEVANTLKNNIDVFIKNELLRLIEQELELFFLDKNQVLQIEKLELSIDNIRFQNDTVNTSELKEIIKNQLSKKLTITKNQLNPTINKDENGNRILSHSEKKANTLIYYLTHGEMPWWKTQNDKVDFNSSALNSFLDSENFKYQFQKIIDQTIVQERLINQFSNQQLAQIISTLTHYKKLFPGNKIILNLSQENDFELKKILWKAVFMYLKNKNANTIIDCYFENIEKFKTSKVTFEEFISSIDQIVANNSIQIDNREKIANGLKPETKNEFLLKNNRDEVFKKGLYVQNAGLIIIHPFLIDFLKNCHLINNENTITDKEMAAHILHYVATKKEQDYEHAMIFEKFLCGIPIHQPIRREITIDHLHKIQIEEMLQAVVQHWNALKSTSTDLLRNEFLQREGKLDIQDGNPRLSVEKKTQDILLNKIPWNISVVKIPWIEKLIYTDW